MNTKLILFSTFSIAIGLFAAAILFRSDTTVTENAQIISFHGFANSTTINAAYISDSHKIEKNIQIKDASKIKLPIDDANAIISLNMKNSSGKNTVINMVRHNNEIQIHIQGLPSREIVSLASNGTTINIPTDWSGQLINKRTASNDTCISYNAHKICHIHHQGIKPS